VSDRIAVLCDFDGTIAQDDVGNLFFKTFARRGDPGPVVELWKQGLISSRECLEREAELAEVSSTEFCSFLNKRKLDPFFKDFVDFTRKRDIEVVIVSDGLDHYIEHMLVRSGLGELEVFSNLMRLVGNNVNLSFPHYDQLDCRDCGNCKSHHLEKLRQTGSFIVYVGNGLSDRCPSARADFVFAKGELLDYCRENDLPHVEFCNFRDVAREILKRFVIGNGAESAGGM
jgi:2,3-diketo-5-methylthio-1-phosphopentane phosphatase